MTSVLVSKEFTNVVTSQSCCVTTYFCRHFASLAPNRWNKQSISSKRIWWNEHRASWNNTVTSKLRTFSFGSRKALIFEASLARARAGVCVCVCLCLCAWVYLVCMTLRPAEVFLSASAWGDCDSFSHRRTTRAAFDVWVRGLSRCANRTPRR